MASNHTSLLSFLKKRRKIDRSENEKNRDLKKDETNKDLKKDEAKTVVESLIEVREDRPTSVSHSELSQMRYRPVCGKKDK